MTVNPSRFPLISSLATIIAVFTTVFLLGPAPAHSQVSIANSCATKTVLFVVSSHTLEPRDEALLNHLTAQGWTVVVRTGLESVTQDANGKDLILISESVRSTDVNNKFRNAPVPLITWEGWIFDDLRMTDRRANKDYGEQLNENRVRITAADHPLAAGLSGDVQMLDASSGSADSKFHWGLPSKNATIVATSRKGSHAYIFAYEAGAAMVGLTAPARRVGFPNASAHHFTAEGWQLFDAATQWAMACADNPATSTPTLIQTAPPTQSPTASPTVTPTGEQTPTPINPTKTPKATPTERPSEPTATATLDASEAEVSVTKMDFLYLDQDQDELVSDGDTLLYMLKVTNRGGKSAQLLRLVDAPDPNSVLVTGSVVSSGGVVVKGNTSGDSHVILEFATLPSSAQAFISFQARVKLQSSTAALQNQAVATFSDQDVVPRGQKTVVSDDPDTAGGPDTTITVLNTPLAQINPRLFLPFVQR